MREGRTSGLRPRDLAALRTRLAAMRAALLEEIASADEDLDEIEATREAELAERSQEEAAADLAARLGERGFRELRQLEGAMERIDSGSYGVCLSCSLPIELARLEARPTALRCAICEAAREAPDRDERELEEDTPPAPLPPDLASLEDAEIADLVRERLADEVGDAVGEVRVACRRGRVILAGEVASDELRQVVQRIVEDEMGLEIRDRMDVSAAFAEWAPRRGRRSGEPPRRPHATARRTTGGEDEEEASEYTPPSRPVPERD